MGEHPNTALLRKGYEAMAAGDLPGVVGMFAPDGVMHVGGDGPFTGAQQGQEAIAQTLGGLFEWTGGTMRLEVEQIFADDQNVWSSFGRPASEPVTE